jgi:hypothetical protein
MESPQLKAAEEGMFLKTERNKDVVVKPMPDLDFGKNSLKDRFTG